MARIFDSRERDLKPKRFLPVAVPGGVRSSTCPAPAGPTLKHVLLERVGRSYALLALEAFQPVLLCALARTMPTDWVSLNSLAPAPGPVIAISEPPVPPELYDLYAHGDRLPGRAGATYQLCRPPAWVEIPSATASSAAPPTSGRRGRMTIA